MADIELVVKIDEEVYRYAKKYNSSSMLTLREEEMGVCMNAIANGTPLPKGHGGLISVKDAVDNLMEYKEIGIFGNYDKLTILGCIDRIKNHVEPIIEEDKEGE